jgi:hypothetical protein
VTVNPHLKAYLDNYLALPSPGFAIMLNAPWGAGKSHAIRTLMDNQRYRLVILFGVDSSPAFENAIFKAQVTSDGAASAAAMMRKVSKYTEKVGFFIDEAFRQKVLEGLPDILIFDDVERVNLTAKELFGVLNKYVEHDKRSVILLADETRLRDDLPDYKAYKEKLVGRTLRLNPDADAAFAAFLLEIPDAETCIALSENQSRLLEVFHLSTFENLRLLRQAMLEFVYVYRALDADMRAKKSAVSDLLALYFALHMEFGKGALSRDDLQGRGGWGGAGLLEDEPPKPIDTARKKYPFNLHDEAILPNALCLALMADGYSDAVATRAALKSTNGFSDTTSEPAWQTLWYWRLREESHVISAIASIQTEIDSLQLQPAGKLLHFFGSLLSLAKSGASEKTASQVVDEALATIDSLARNGVLPPWTPENHHGFSDDIGSYNGFGFSERGSDEFRTISAHLKAVQRQLFEQTHSAIAVTILAKIPAQFDEAVAELENLARHSPVPGCSDIPVLKTQDPAKVAKLFTDLPPDRTRKLFQVLASRVETQTRHTLADPENETELGWLRRFHAEVLHIAGQAVPFRRAQITDLTRWDLAKKLQSSEPPEPTP